MSLAMVEISRAPNKSAVAGKLDFCIVRLTHSATSGLCSTKASTTLSLMPRASALLKWAAASARFCRI